MPFKANQHIEAERSSPFQSEFSERFFLSDKNDSTLDHRSERKTLFATNCVKCSLLGALLEALAGETSLARRKGGKRGK